jgi:hypothetical protein
MAASSIADILAVPYLDGRVIDSTQSLVAIKVNAVHRLEFSCQEVSGVLVSITIHRLC